MTDTERAASTGPAATLLVFYVHEDGATMRCRYCDSAAPIHATRVADQTVRFQDAHFACDPMVRPAAAPPTLRTGDAAGRPRTTALA